MRFPFQLRALDQLHSSYLILLALAALGVLAALLFKVGLVGAAVRLFGMLVRGSVRLGFFLWKRLLAWASWPVFLAIVLGWLGLGWMCSARWPALTVLCGLAPLFMGLVACLAYVFLDLERYEVGRGYKALHNPLKGQELATQLLQFGHRVGVPLLIAATVGVIGGFALLNQGLYLTVGSDWYSLAADQSPGYADFLAYPLINLYRIVDLLDLASSYHFLRIAYVRAARWPASTLLVLFRTFFTLVLLQQIFASVRQGMVLAETIAEFWSPHPPIHERARGTLSQHGVSAVGPLLASLRGVPFLTKEQREQIPLVIAGIGPAAIPVLVRHLNDVHENVRAVTVAALGSLHALDALPLLIPLRADASEWVRQSLVEALGVIGSPGVRARVKRRWVGRVLGSPGRGFQRLLWWRKHALQAPAPDSLEPALATLQGALADPAATVRIQAARSLGRIGPQAAAAGPALIAVLEDKDETVRCQAAESLGKIGGPGEGAVNALVMLLQDPSPPVKAAAAQALGALKKEAATAVPSLVLLLQDQDESVRKAAAEAIGQIGTLSAGATDTLVEGLASPDSMVRAQTAEALGTIGATAQEAAPALVEALEQGTDRVRGKAAEALGKIGEAAADVAVPSLVRALRRQDSWVSALAAEALGEMGESADQAVPALIRSLRHMNPRVRANAAEALGKIGASARGALPDLERTTHDEEGEVRSQAVRALGEIGQPTPTSQRVILAALDDVDPQVRAAAVEAVGKLRAPGEEAVRGLLHLLEDANDQVKLQVTKVLPKMTHATSAVVDGLCRRLLRDDNPEVQVAAALALGQLGPAAGAAGGALLRAAQTGDVQVRDQAMRAIAIIQPPETTAALLLGMRDGNGDIRKVASGGWIKAATVPEEAVPALVEALRDPEVQVRTNAAQALARLDSVPAEAIPVLIECTTDPDDSLRMQAAMALQGAPAGAARAAMQHLIEDPNLRIRLIAARALLVENPGHPEAIAVLREALGDPALRVRRAAIELIDSLGTGGLAFLEALRQRAEAEDEPAVVDVLTRVLQRLEQPFPQEPASTTDSPASITNGLKVGIYPR